MRLLAGVLHSDEIVWNSYTWDADAHKQINTNQQKGVINNEAITTLSNPSQLTHAGFYRIAACSADVNSQVEADSMKFTAYTTGDFYVFPAWTSSNNFWLSLWHISYYIPTFCWYFLDCTDLGV